MSPGNGEYALKLDEFLTRNGTSNTMAPVEIYHAVRNIPYSSRGGRDPELVLADNAGSCSGKHILLRDLLRHSAQDAVVETVQGDFAASVPVVEGMSAKLQHYCQHGGINDFHQYVVWQSPNGECKLDATWPDFLAAMGFPDNAGWAGQGDTKLALIPDSVLDRVEDVPAYKEQLLEELTNDERMSRLHFLTLLSDWMMTIENRGDIE